MKIKSRVQDGGGGGERGGEVAEQLCVDAAQFGSAARFINHSCRPNLAPVRVFTDVRDLRLPNVALFALRDIAAGEELTFDYGDKFWSVKSKFMKCECDAPDCRYPTKSTEE
ncbi:Histone-lysine N-methyltransferase EHMT1 [Papilio machaon]|uniref:Histone-lysine N-methyltransferase EHMT1 n=1 Tax=Papilio machaon TaxID=76193 RepID=A0A0N1IQR8_PAPMA|nr:Histone-lysine N-methyltransferase EHMT1 [Papilio machaon]